MILIINKFITHGVFMSSYFFFAYERALLIIGSSLSLPSGISDRGFKHIAHSV